MDPDGDITDRSFVFGAQVPRPFGSCAHAKSLMGESTSKTPPLAESRPVAPRLPVERFDHPGGAN
jgi:hypothetical protein